MDHRAHMMIAQRCLWIQSQYAQWFQGEQNADLSLRIRWQRAREHVANRRGFTKPQICQAPSRSSSRFAACIECQGTAIKPRYVSVGQTVHWEVCVRKRSPLCFIATRCQGLSGSQKRYYKAVSSGVERLCHLSSLVRSGSAH